MNIDALIKQEIISKLGTLTFAYVELSSTVAVLGEIVKQRDATIADLKMQLVEVSGERDDARSMLADARENLPANPYGDTGGPH